MGSKASVLLPAITALIVALWMGPVCAQASDAASARSETETIRDARLPEPLVAVGATSSVDDRALADALATYQHRSKPDDLSALASFVSQHPQSGWTTAVLTNMGLLYVHYGYYSKALDAWEDAWRLGKNATDAPARTLVDRALGEMAQLDASLGRFKSLATLFREMGDRKVAGPATESIQVARELLDQVKKDPRHLYLCGPQALKSLMIARGASPEQVGFINTYRATPRGTSLADVAHLADKAKVSYRLVYRRGGQPVPVPSIVHWKLGHFAAIVGAANGRFHVVDPSFPDQEVWVTPGAMDAEASGYFLTLGEEPDRAGWRKVDMKEAAGIRGKGPTSGTQKGLAGPLDVPADGKPNDCPMCGYNILESTVSISLSDSPVGYSPPIGPSARVSLAYNQREDSQPANFNFFNVGPKWTINWLSYVSDDPTNPGATVSRYLAGGGAYNYTGYQSATGRFTAQANDGSILVQISQSPVTYRHTLHDGSVEIYAQSDGSTSYPRRIFLSKVVDPQGNTLTLNYDAGNKLISLTDAVGRQTSFTYGSVARPLLITKITDPFGRSASLTYDGNGRLSAITDVIGLTSSFAYDGNSLVNAMTTPYGTTNFSYTAPGTAGAPRFAQVTDPMGYSEREEWIEPASVPASDPSATLPQGMPVTLTNNYLQYRDSFHWDKDAYVAAGCTPTGGCDYSKARDRHFNHVQSGTNTKSGSIESEKYPLENRIWYEYPGQTNSIDAGSYEQPVAIGRVLGDGTTQLRIFSYDSSGYFNLTQIIDPVGRVTTFAYANQIDLVAMSQKTVYGDQVTLAQYAYNAHHRPLYAVDAAGQVTRYAYNTAGQPTSVTNPLNQTTTYQYDGAGNLTSITNANSAVAESYTYDAYDRIATRTDSEGWTATYSYDNANRITKITYPDGTADIYTFDKLDLASYTDRNGRRWIYSHDADRRLVASKDPLGNTTLFGYSNAARLTSLTDAKGNVTSWTYDIEGRLTNKQYADASSVGYVYEATTSRLASTTDALGQTVQYAYTKDDRVSGITYLNAVNPTPAVSFTYDPNFPRLSSMTDGTGTSEYAYVPPGALGALHMATEHGSLPNSTISYGYDELGRLVSHSTSGAGAETFQYDAIGRVVARSDDLGSFSLAYLGQTNQIAQRQLLPAGSSLKTQWSYLNNAGDRRLESISNVGLSTSQYSNFHFATNPIQQIISVSEETDSTSVYPTAGSQTASYNNLNQATAISGQALSYDANGNLLSDGARTYSWDAENRLIGITYPSQAGKQTAFTYDGIGRRVTIASTPAGGGTAVSTSYIWCGANICQSRDSGNAVTREYYPEGEFVPGSPGQTLYYGVDQLGSVRRVFATTTSSPAYGFDPYGKPLQGTAPLADFGYAGTFYNADSGLYLTRYRAYDPVAGRWLSRDPSGEGSDPASNLYRYANGDPAGLYDPSGQFGVLGAVVGAAAFGLGDVAFQLYKNNGNFSCVNPWEVAGAAAGGALLVASLGLAGPEELALAEGGSLTANAARGAASEARVLDELGLTKNTQSVATAEGRAVPDALTDKLSVEIKDRAYVAQTRQIRIQTEAAGASGRQSVLITGENTKVSGPAENAFDVVIRRPDLGPQ